MDKTAYSCPSSGLIAVAYLPHGPMLLDPNERDIPDSTKAIYSVCMKISQEIADLKPDLIILSTPHGLGLQQAVNIYQPGPLGTKASGSFEWNSRYEEYRVEVELDQEASRDLYFSLRKEQHRLPKIEAMGAFAGLNIPLMWAEVVPLYFLLHQMSPKTTDSPCRKHVRINSTPKFVIIAQPELGLTIFSGDQAHTHPWSLNMSTACQPHPAAHHFFPQCGTEHAEPFDQAISDWMTGKTSHSREKLFRLDEKLLIDKAGQYEEIAFSCGYSGSLTMQGVMENESIQSLLVDPTEPINRSADWLLTNFIFHHPSYYGMMATLHIRNKPSDAI